MAYLMTIKTLLILLLMEISYEADYSPNSDMGIRSRIDLFTTMKLAIKMAKPPPTASEKTASTVFAKFLYTSEADEYLEAYYEQRTSNKINPFVSFLNGFIYNGDPYLPAWHAAEKLIKMIQTKTNYVELERERAEARDNYTKNAARTKDLVGIKRLDPNIYIEMFN